MIKFISENAGLLALGAVCVMAIVYAVMHAYRRGWDDRGRELADRVLLETRNQNSIRI